VDEFVSAKRDADVRRAGRDRREEHEVARFDVLLIDPAARTELLRHGPRHGDPVLPEYVADEPAAIEP
jgi:hypothetical protein